MERAKEEVLPKGAESLAAGNGKYHTKNKDGESFQTQEKSNHNIVKRNK
jgi:hypothetical protein